MSIAQAVTVALTFVWFGMVAGISFLEAPLRFRAPGVTLQLGLGIGRLVFRALNRIELVFAIVIAVALLAGPPSPPVGVGYGVAVAALAGQLVLVRPVLNRRADQVLAGAEGPRSRGHLYYIGLEAVKMIALITAGALLVFS